MLSCDVALRTPIKKLHIDLFQWASVSLGTKKEVTHIQQPRAPTGMTYGGRENLLPLEQRLVYHGYAIIPPPNSHPHLQWSRWLKKIQERKSKGGQEISKTGWHSESPFQTRGLIALCRDKFKSIFRARIKDVFYSLWIKDPAIKCGPKLSWCWWLISTSDVAGSHIVLFCNIEVFPRFTQGCSVLKILPQTSLVKKSPATFCN